MAKLKPWEDICDRCGKCCTNRFLVGELQFDKASRCNFYDDEKGCTVYQTRSFMNPKCVTLTPMNVGAWLPPTCAYLKLTAGELIQYALAEER